MKFLEESDSVCVKVHQQQDIKSIQEKFGLSKANTVAIPASPSVTPVKKLCTKAWLGACCKQQKKLEQILSMLLE